MPLPPPFSYKPVDYRSKEEWYQNNAELLQNTKVIHRESSACRHRSQELRNKALRTTEWHLRETNNSLNDRKTDIGFWWNRVENARQNSETQLLELIKAKTATEQSLQDKNPYLAAVRCCLDIRDRRRDIDLVRDDVHVQLEKEQEFLEKSKDKLLQKSEELWTHRIQLNELLQIIKREESSKLLSLQRDETLENLAHQSPEISLKPFAVENHKLIMSERHWIEQLSEKLLELNVLLDKCRETVSSAYSLIRELELELDVERHRTQALKRKRLQEFENQRDMLTNQKQRLETEIPRLHREILETNGCLNEMKQPMKLAQTRLERRKWAHKNEIVDDLPHNVLLSEVETTEKTQLELDMQLQESKKNLFFLHEQLQTINKELELKDNTIKMENQSLHTHENASMPSFNCKSLTYPTQEEPQVKEEGATNLLEEFYNNLKISEQQTS